MTAMSCLDQHVIGQRLLGAVTPECIDWNLLSCIAERFGEALAVDVLDMYSLERFAELCGRLGLKQGCSLDITNGFDLGTVVDRTRAWAIFEKDQPSLVIGSPPCTYFTC